MPSIVRLIAALEPTANKHFVVVSGDPSASPGIDLGTGSIAIAQDTAAIYIKNSAVATDWTVDTSADITPASLTGAHAAVNADKNVIGSLPLVFRIDLAAGALADTDVIMTHKVRVIDAYHILRGAGVASTTLTVKNGANAITNAMAASGADTALVRATTIDDANYEIPAAGTLRVTSAAGATQPAATVYVLAIRVA